MMTMPPQWRRNLVGALGTLVGMLVVSYITRWWAGADPAGMWLVAPVGASALLVFALPASPLAQPWPVLGGHLTSAAIGLVMFRIGMAAPLAVALAVGLATGAMMLARCVHPPAGGTAVLMALGSPAIAKAGWGFLAMPIGANLVVLIGTAVIWHRLTGHSYPQRQMRPRERPSDLMQIEALLAESEDMIDISAEDLAKLIRAFEAKHRAEF